MARRLLITLAVVAGVLLVAGVLFRESILLALLAGHSLPEHDFDPAAAPPPPDYTTADAWAAHPATPGPAGEFPDDGTRAALPVSAFFLHPTTYLTSAGWNQPPGDEAARWIVDQRVMRHQASAFNGCCRVYAPRYRQATIFSFLDRSGNGEAALALAYQDVLAAFERFLTEIDGQPFILAGHSQGSAHAARLLRERIAGTELQTRLVAAYLVGFSIEKDQIGGIPVCDHPRATRCAVGWNTVEGASAGLFPDTESLICTNPLTWEDDGAYAGHGLNLGGVGFSGWGPREGEDPARMVVEQGVADAQCRDGMLAVPELRSESFPSRMAGDSMHVYDYSLFYLNVRDNAMTRARAFLDTR